MNCNFLLIFGFLLIQTITICKAIEISKDEIEDRNIITKKLDPTCMKPVDQEKSIEIANQMGDIVNKALDAARVLINDPSKRSKYTDVNKKVIDSLKGGWGKPDAIDGIGSAIADPLKDIPKGGNLLSAGVKTAIKTALNARKKEMGC